MDDIENKKPMSVGVAIITWKDKRHIAKCLAPLINSPLKPKIIVFNSSATDGTVEVIKEYEKDGVELLLIPRTEMNHGWAREISRKTLGTDIVVMMTPDAYAQDEHMLEKLVQPIMEGKASVAYARQIPHEGANEIIQYGRAFGYPPKSNFRSIDDAPRYGSYTAFVSDACCAWSNRALDEIGGFRWVLSGEDAVAASMLVKKGHKVAYVAEAVVYHSHDYGPKKEFIRHFDTGLYRHQWKDVLDMGIGSDEQRGMSYAKGLFQFLWQKNKKLIPRAFMQLAMGWLGYKVGWYTLHKMPTWFYKKISPADFFWNSVDYKAGRWMEPAK